MKVSETEIYDIKTSLMTEYPKSFVDDMIKNAKLTKTAMGVDVEYKNGVVDNFIFIKKLVHSSELAI